MNLGLFSSNSWTGYVKEKQWKRPSNLEAKFHASCRIKCNSTKLKRKHAEAFSESDVEGQGQQKSLRGELEKTERKVCFLCGEEGNSKDLTLRNASTFQLDEKEQKCAILLQDEKLLAKLSAGDILAQELKYHTSCLIRLYRRAQPNTENNEEREQMLNGLVFAELVEHIQEERDQAPEDELTVFKLADLPKSTSNTFKTMAYLAEYTAVG